MTKEIRIELETASNNLKAANEATAEARTKLHDALEQLDKPFSVHQALNRVVGSHHCAENHCDESEATSDYR